MHLITGGHDSATFPVQAVDDVWNVGRPIGRSASPQ
jgi:hypothetical protein